MTTTALLAPILDGGIQYVNFINGQLLSAEDLSNEQMANQQVHAELGQGIGAGIISGFQVRVSTSAGATPNTLTVSAGLAVNPNGRMLALPSDIDVVLGTQARQPAAQTGPFAECTVPGTQAQPNLTGIGAFVLTVSPASGFEGLAPTSGVSGISDGGAACRSRYVVAGIKFALVPINLANVPWIGAVTSSQISTLMAQTDPASQSLLRNLLAHLCFGTEERTGFAVSPYGWLNSTASVFPTYRVLDRLRSLNGITDCDVPLALVFWSGSGVQFVDLGSTRRRPLPGAPPPSWPLEPAGGYPSVGEAISVQFQEQVAALQNASTSVTQLALVTAATYFRYLPAAGVIPILGTITQRGFTYPTFFNTLTCRQPVIIEGALVESILRESFAYPPIDLTSGNALFAYWVRENQQATAATGSTMPQPYLLFTSGYMPYRGDAHFDLSHFDFANFAACCGE
jgi:hypothetical protein